MATVTSFKASVVQAILDATIVDGSVVADELILECHDGSTINLGVIVGPAVGGDAGAVYAKNTATDYDADWTTTPSLEGLTLVSAAESGSFLFIDVAPEGVETAEPGSLRFVSDGTAWIKLTGSSDTGWSRIIDDSQTNGYSYVQYTSAHTLDLSDMGKYVELDSAFGIVLNIPTNATTAFPIGTKIPVSQLGAGVITFTPAGGVTLLSRDARVLSNGQYAEALLHKRATNEWYLSGDVA